MPISDEIIELEPVKKSKSKLIIMFVAMGLLLAMAVAFLVLYLLKPSVEDSAGHVNGVVGETSALFVGDGDVKYASVGNDYTVYADVSAEGSADPGVNWTWDPLRAITEISHGSTDGEGGATRFYFTFRPSADYADGSTPVTITARSMSDVNQRAEITFYIVNQGTEDISIQRISHDGGAYTNITYNDDGEISLPYYSNDKNNKLYTVSFAQLGKYNPTTGLYSDLTRSQNGKDGQPTYKVDISTDKAESVISNLRVVESTDDNESFRFKLCGTGVATITLTANNYNDFGEPYSVTVKIKAESTETLGYIDDIRIYDTPVDDTDGKFYKENVNKQYTMDNYGAIPKSSTVFTIPYSVPSYTNFLQHIVILPLSIQYNEDGTRKTDWMSRISVSSSLTDLLDVSNDALKNVILKTNSYGAKNTCTLSVSNADKLGVTVTSSINVNVIARNTQGSIAVKKDGSSTTEDVSKKISTSQGSSLDVSVVYNLVAPSDVDKEIFITSNYLSKGYTVSMVSEETGEAINDFEITLGGKEIEWGKQLTVSSMTIEKVGTDSSTAYTGTITFKLTVPDDIEIVPDGDYTFTFTKIGTAGLTDTAGKVVYDLDTTWSQKITLSVTAKAHTAMFISEEEGAELARLGGSSGNFVLENATKARLYLQNRSGTLPIGFDFKNFVKVVDGVSTINVSCASSTGNLTVTGSVNNQTFTFPGKKSWNESAVQGVVTLTAKNNAEEVIGTFEIDIYLIDAIESIYVEDEGDSDFVYDKESIEAGGTSFSVNRVLNKYTFLQDADVANNAEKKYNSAAHDNFELYSRLGSDLTVDEPFAKVVVGNNIEFRYPDKNGTTVFEYISGKIYPRVDLFEFSYNNNINVTVLTIRYYTVPDERFETDDDIKSCGREYTFTRRADDVALFESDSYSDNVRISPVINKFTYEINMGDIGRLYASAVVNIKKVGEENVTPIVVKYVSKYEDNKEFVNRLGLEAVCMEKPGTVGDNFVITSGESNGTGYNYIVFTAPQISGDEATYTAVVHGAGNRYTLDINVLNRARPVEKIELFVNNTSTPLTLLDFGEFGNAHTDPYQKSFIVKATFVKYDDPAEDMLYTQLEPITIALPNDNYVLTADGVTYQRSATYELVASRLVTDQYYYIWNCTLTLADDATDKSGGTFKAYDKFPDGGDNTMHITASAPITVGTGAESIDFTVGGQTYNITSASGSSHTVNIEFVLTSATDVSQKIEIPIEVKPYSDSFGNKSIKYDISNLTLRLDSVDGLVGLNGLGGNKLVLTLDSANVKTLNKEYVFTLTDTANGANTVFLIKLNVTVKADIYAIDLADKYTVTTTGADSGDVSVSGALTFNGGNSALQPDSEYKNNVVIKAVVGGEGATEEVAGGKITIGNFDRTNGTFSVIVSNSILNGEYSLRVSYTTTKGVTIVKYVPIVISTTSNEVKWLSKADGNVEITDGNADITVKKSTDEFKFIAAAYNRGNGDRVADGSTVITYAIYDSAANRSSGGSVSTVAQVNGGIVKVVSPTTPSGMLYLRASYVDASSGKTFFTDVDITYTVVISTLEIDGAKVDGDTLNANVITLYYLNGSAYTVLNLANAISVNTAFGGVSPIATPMIRLESGDTNVLSIAGYRLTPLKSGTTTLTITATDGKEALTKEYTVNVIALDALVLAENSGTIDIVKNGSVDVTRIVADDKYNGLVATYDVSGPAKISIGSIVDNKTATVTVARDSFGANDYKKYTLTATTEYRLKDGSSLGMVGMFSVSTTYELTVEGTYIYSFDLYVDGSKLNENSVNEINANATYKVKINEPTDAWYSSSDFKYTASDDNGIATVGAFSNGEAVLTFDTSKAGVISLTVTAAAYGKMYSATSKAYTFSYGSNFSTKLQSSSVGSTTFTDFADKDSSSKTIAVDHDDSTAKKVIRYVIDVSNIGGTVSDVNINYVGVATADTVKYDAAKKQYYRDFTLDAQTTLILSGSFVVGGREYITDKYTLTLTATEPDFVLTEQSNKTELKASNKDAFETATFTVGNSASAFMGATKVTYAITAGGDKASIDANTGVLTPNLTANSIGGSVVVSATVQVTSGVFAGKTYTVSAVIAIKGVTLPTLTVSNSTITTNTLANGVGTTVELNNKFELSGDPSFAYTYAYTYSVVEATGLTSGVDYAISGSVLTVKDTDVTKAGGKIKVRIRATVTSEINKGAFAEDTVEVVILPRAKQSASAVNVSGAVGSYDIKRAVVPYTYDMTGFVNSTDTYSVVYTLAASVDGVSVDGDRLVISKAVTTTKQIALNATITFTGNSAYKGTSITVTGITVNICGITFTTKTVSWQTETEPYGYEHVTVADQFAVDATVKSITVVIENNASFVTVADNGTTSPVISIDKDFNIATSGTKQIKYSAVIEVTKDGQDHSYYGEGVITVNYVAPELNVTIDSTEYADGGNYSVYVGDSFNISFAETHGLNIDSIVVGDIGSGLSCIPGGVNCMFTATAESEAKEVVFSVMIGDVNIQYTINITVNAKPSVAPFTATNTSISLSYVSGSYGQSTVGSVTSVLIPSSDYATTSARQLYVSTSSTLGQKVSGIYVYGYDASGNKAQIGHATPSSYSSYVNISLSSGSYVSYDIQFNFNLNVSTSFALSTTFYWTNLGSGGTSTSYSFSYSVTKTSGYVYVTYESEGSEFDNVAYTYNQVVTAPVSNPTRAGYEFVGWYTVPDPDPAKDSAHLYAFGSNICSSITLYAGWNKKSYTVTYNGNGGTINGSSYTTATANYGEKYNALPSSSAMSRTGYDFNGWYTAINGGNLVTANSLCSIDGDHTLYAHWTAKTYTVTFNATTGTLDALSQSKTVTFGEAYGTLPTPTCEGYEFTGWTFNGGAVTSATVVATARDHEFTANWAAKTYAVTYNANGGAVNGSNSVVVNQTYNANYAHPANPTRDGYTFGGWVDADGKAVTSSTKMTTAGAHTLYATWTADTISIMLNDGVSLQSIERTFGERYDLPTLTRDGYTFKYWYVQGGSDATAFSGTTVGSEALADGGLTLVAKWEANTYYVFLNYDDGTGHVEAFAVTYGATYDLATPTRDGFTFDGWYSNSDGAETEYTADTTVGSEALSGLILYAKWIAD